MSSNAWKALRLATIYVVLSLLWIYFGDRAVEALSQDSQTIRYLQTWKGAAFVAVTGVLIFLLSWQALARQGQLIHRLRYFAYNNKLTGLPNRIAAGKMLRNALRRGHGDRHGVGLVVFDIDGFSHINDSFGHAAGDELLIAVAGRLARLDDDRLWLAHSSADEFMCIVSQLNGRDELAATVEKLRALFSKPFSVQSLHSVYATVCIGTSCFPHDAEDAEHLFQYADAALARAKREGPGSLERYSRKITERVRRLVMLEAGLREAIEREELQLHYQPLLSGDKQLKPVSFEALMRWQPRGEKPVSPAELIPAAERSGLIVELGDWALRQVCAQMAEWSSQGLPPLPVAVNVSAQQFSRGGLLQTVTTALEAHGLASDRLIIEITETVIMSQHRQVLDLLGRLRQTGIGLALDDFGTGYSSLAYLRNLPVSSLKIDRAFIMAIDQGDAARDLVEAIVALARIFELSVIAEGVESENQLEFLRTLGCDRYQGFLFGRPMPSEAVPGWLARYSDQ